LEINIKNILFNYITMMGNANNTKANKSKTVGYSKTWVEEPEPVVELEEEEEEEVEELEKQEQEQEEEEEQEQEEELEEQEEDVEEEEQEQEEEVEEQVDAPTVVDESDNGQGEPIEQEDVSVENISETEQGSVENPLLKIPVSDKNTSFQLLIAFINLAFSRGAYTKEEVEKIIECINMFTV